ncbi:MAG: amidophosphoribosyltransferase [Oscillospiraceae bacterium]|nr:amidophosphoribosyltransferase [Oscillospiraceae bacterium]
MLKEECGVFGICSKPQSDVVLQTFYALYALQHRGQESCGIAVNDDGVIEHFRDAGLVPEVFNQERLAQLGRGNMALGHVLYSSKQGLSRSNAQPLVVRHIKGPMALAFNGSLTNAYELREELEMNGAIFHSDSDIEVIGYVLTRARLRTPSIEKAVEAAMHELHGAYSLIVMSSTKMIAARDPLGFRPLCMGKLDGDTVFASETCALDSVGASFNREVEPGEIVLVNKSGTHSIRTHCRGGSAFCALEFIYFSRPDSVISGQSVHLARQEAGRFLAQESPADADVVIGVPDSGLDAALGYSKESGIPYDVGFIKNRYIGRTFIQKQSQGVGSREQAVKIKLNTVDEAVRGKRVALIDDSIVRGTTFDRIVKLLREAGAKEVHIRIAAPPFLHPCFFGVEIESRDNLIACRMSQDEIRRHFGADSIGYLSIEGLHNASKGADCSLCDACFTGNYPIPVPAEKPVSKYVRKLSEKGGSNHA